MTAPLMDRTRWRTGSVRTQPRASVDTRGCGARGEGMTDPNPYDGSGPLLCQRPTEPVARTYHGSGDRCVPVTFALLPPAVRRKEPTPSTPAVPRA